MPDKLNIDRLNRWLTLGANIGVVLGLIILIFEVRQNAVLTRTAMELQKNNALAQIELSFTPETTAAWVKSIRAPEDLTDVELRLVEARLVAVGLHVSDAEERSCFRRACSPTHPEYRSAARTPRTGGGCRRTAGAER